MIGTQISIRKTILLLLVVMGISVISVPAPVPTRLELAPPADLPIQWRFNPPYSNFLKADSYNQTTRSIRYYLGTPTYSSENQDLEHDSIRAALDQWSSIPDTHIQFEEAGILENVQDINLEDGKNTIVWAVDSDRIFGGQVSIRGIAAVNLSSFTAAGHVLESDTILNAKTFRWSAGTVKTDRLTALIEPAVLHELGHLLGLAHSPIGASTMFFQSDFLDASSFGLSIDEIIYARDVYKDNSGNDKFGSIKGNITVNGVAGSGTRVIIEDERGYLIGATVSENDGNWRMGGIPPGNYTIRLDPFPRRGSSHQDTIFILSDIDFRFGATDPPQFKPTKPEAITIQAGIETTWNKALANGEPLFQIQLVMPITDSEEATKSFTTGPVSTTLDKEEIFIGVYSTDLPLSGVSLRTTHPEIIVHETEIIAKSVLSKNLIYSRVSLPENIQPGILSFIVETGGEEVYANGFMEIIDPKADYNFDGLSDSFQREHFSPFTRTEAGPDQDPDADGFPNRYEERSKTDPNDPLSFQFLIQEVEVNENGTKIVWESIPGRTYRLWSRPESSSGEWVLVLDNFVASHDLSEHLDTKETENIQFYRVEKID